jgi:hypothetical protein
MRIKTPRLPDPTAIRNEIDALKARIGELRALLPLAEVQHLRKSIQQSDGARKAVPSR